MADFLLTVGVDAQLSYKEMAGGIRQLTKALNLNPPKLKVELDEQYLKKFRSQIEELSESIRKIGTITIPSGNTSGANAGTMQYRDAAQAVREYYSTLKTLNKSKTDITFTPDGWKSASGNYSALASELNRTKKAMDLVTNSMNTMPMKQQIRLQEVLNAEAQKYNEIIRQQSNAARESADSSQQQTTSQASQIRMLNKSITLQSTIEKNAAKWTAAKNGKSKVEYQSYIALSQALDLYRTELGSGAMSQQEFNQKVIDAESDAKRYARVIEKNSEAHKTLFDRIGGLAKKFTTWFGVSRIIMAAYREIRRMVTAVTELDTAMTELKKVTNETDATYDRFLENAASRAKKLGATMSDIVTATADFARLGFSIEEAEKLADAAIVYKNVGDGIEDINTASESIIATMQAFGLGAEDAMLVVDKFNEVGNNYAISSKGVGDALLRSAAAMHSANNTLDETIALAAAANTVVQDPDKVGTTLKTVSMYLRAAKTEAEDAGESTDGMAESVSELREELLSLTGNKVDIQTDDNTFKSTYQILKELSAVWHELTDVSQANILEIAGGKRNANVVAAILDNFSVANDAIETSAGAANSALEENAKVLESIEGKISIFKATFEELSNNLIGSDLIKLVVDFGTGLLSFVNGVIELCNALGGLKTMLLGTIAVLVTFRTEWVLTTATMIGTTIWSVLTKGFNFIIGIIPAVVSKINNLIFAWNMYQTTAIGTAEATAAASAVMQAAVPVIGLVLAAITALVGGIALYNNAQDKAAQKSTELTQAWQSENDSINDTITKYKELKESIDSGILSTDEMKSAKEELASIQQDLVDKYGSEAAGIDLVNGKYIEQLGILEKVSIAKAKEYVAENKSNIKKDKDYLSEEVGVSSSIDGYKGYNSISKENQKILSKYSNLYTISDVEGDGTTVGDLLIKAYGKREDVRQSLIDAFNEFNSKADDESQAIADAISKMLNDDTIDSSKIEESKNNVSQYALADILDGSDTRMLYGEATEAVEQYNNALASGEGVDEAKANLDKVRANVDKAFGKNGILKNIYGADDVFNALWDNVSDGAENASNNTNKAFSDSRTSMISSLNAMSEGFESLDKIYSSIKDKNPFDFKLLDDKNFKDTFSGLDSYADFIEQITSNSDDIEACKSAFNNLVTEWINTKGVLDNVTEENEKLTVSMLKQMGIANAETIVANKLALDKEKLRIETELGKDATLEGIMAMYGECEAGSLTQQALAQLAIEKMLVNENKIITSGDIDQIIALAESANATSASLERLAKVKAVIAKSEAFAEEAKESSGRDRQRKITLSERYAERAQELMSQPLEYNKFDSSDFKVDYTGGSTSNKNSGSSKETKETFDWIEIALSRIQRTITNLGKTVSATWKSWIDRNKALKEQMSGVRTEISLQQQAYNKYMSLANSVGLAEPYASLVRNGAMDISTITDENLAEKIKLYQEYWEAALDAYDAVLDLENELANLAQTEFDNTAKRYDDELSMHEHQISMLESSADILETRGYMVGAGIYDALIQQENARLTDLKNKYASLESILNSSSITKYSEQWYAMQLEILGVKEEIQNTTKALSEYDNTLREIGWNIFDKLQEKISAITTEANFLIDLMSDEKMFNDDGSITKHGQATLGLHAVNYNTYMAQADEYATELQQINAELANDPYNQTLLERRDELLEQQRDMILAAEDEKQAMKDLMSEGYDALLGAMEEIIDKRKEMLSQIKDLYDYEKSIAEQTADVTKYQKIIDSMQGMADTEEGKAALQKYEVSLKEAQENLEETEYEKYISDQEQMLDSLYDKTEEWINSRLDDLDAVIQEVIASTNTNASEIKTTLETEASNVGTTLTAEMEKIWSTNGTFTQVVANYSKDFQKGLTTVNGTLLSIKDLIAKMVKDAEAKAAAEAAAANPPSQPDPAPAPSTPAPSTNTGSSGGSSWGSWFISKTDSYPKSQLRTETSIVDRLKYHNIDSSWNARASYYASMGGSGTYTGSSQQNQWMIAQMKAHGFTDGGTIGRLIRASGEDGFILAKTGEEILSLEKIKALGESFSMMYPVVNALSKLPSLNGINPYQDGKMVQIAIGDIQMYGVNDPETFALQLKDNMLNNSSIRKIMKDTTIGEALGKNSMIRYTR